MSKEPSFRVRSLDRIGATYHGEKLSSNARTTTRSSSAATGTHKGTPPFPALKRGTGVIGVPGKSTAFALVSAGMHVFNLTDRRVLETTGRHASFYVAGCNASGTLVLYRARRP